MVWSENTKIQWFVIIFQTAKQGAPIFWQPHRFAQQMGDVHCIAG